MCLILRHDHAAAGAAGFDDDPAWAKVSSHGVHRQSGHDDPWETRHGFGTSVTEVVHLLAAIVLLSGIFAIYLKKNYYADDPWWQVSVIAAVASATGFLLHELSHKVVAQFYGHWAEFRAQWWGLVFPYPLVLFTNLIFAAPGAVIISGFVTRRQNGLISAAGPGMNLFIVGLSLPFARQPGAIDSFGGKLAFTLIFLNAILALFNMLPFGPLDGRKVWSWNPLVYLLMLGLAIAALLFVTVLPPGQLLG